MSGIKIWIQKKVQKIMWSLCVGVIVGDFQHGPKCFKMYEAKPWVC